MEEILVPLIIFSFIFLMVNTFVGYFKWKKEHESRTHGTGEESGLRTSELKALLREAVEEANAPLIERIEALEAELAEQHRPRLLPAQPLLADFEEPEPARLPLAQRRRLS